MELDDLRRQWQQSVPAAAPPVLDAAAVARLLAVGSASPVAKMRRNVWVEIGIAVVCLLGCVGAAITAHDTYYLTMAAWLGLVCALSGLYFRRKLLLLRSLGDASGGAVREYVQQQLHQLRSLVALYYRATMWSIPVSLGIAMLFIGGRIAQQFSGQKLLVGLGILGACCAVLGIVTYWLMGRFTRWYLQRLYGQHLDRLEGLLRELEE